MDSIQAVNLEVLRSLTLAQPDPWAPAVLVDEFDTGTLEGFTDSLLDLSKSRSYRR